jgi:plastocyanin
VPVGGTVTFVNRDRASHTATAERGFDTGRLKRDQRRPVRFGEAGRIEYLCSFHPYMKAVVEVE